METFFHDKSQSKLGHPAYTSESESRNKWAFDLKRGTAISNFEKKCNSVSTTRYNLLTFIPYTLFSSFSRSGNLFYLVMSIIMLVRDDLTPFFEWIYIFQLLFFISLYMIKELVMDMIRKKYKSMINKRKVLRGMKKNGDLEECLWKELEVGDIIKLKKGEVCPADIVLLDSNDICNKEAVCYIDSSDNNGRTSLQRKKSCSVTQLLNRSNRKNKFVEYRKMLTGTVEYECPQNDMSKFTGILKLKKDPKKGVLSIDNLILRGSIIKHTGWVFGLVVYAGKDTKIMRNSNYTIKKSSFLEKICEYYIFFTIFIVLIFAIISTIVLVARTKDLTFIIEYDSTITDTIRIFTYIILYSPMVPLSLYGTIDFVTIIEKIKLERKYNRLLLSIPDAYFNINNPSILPNLGHIDYVCLDKTGTITKPNFNLSRIYVNNKIYLFSDESLNNLTKQYDDRYKTSLFKYNKYTTNEINEKDIIVSEISESEHLNEHIENNKETRIFGDLSEKNKIFNTSPEKRPLKFDSPVFLEDLKDKERKDEIHNSWKSRGSMSPNSNKVPMIESKGLNFDSKNNYISPLSPDIFKEEERFYEDISNKQGNSEEFMKSLVLCHGARVVYEGTDKKLFESYRKEEETVLQFAKCCSFQFEKANKFENPDIYTVLENGNRMNYNILGTNDFSYSRRRFSLVVKGEKEDSAVLYCKGPLNSMRGILKMSNEELDILDSIVKDFRDKGLKCVFYAKKTLSNKEAESFSKNIHNLKFSLMSQTKELETLAINMENKLEMLGLVGLKEEVKEESRELIEFFNSLNINVWLLSGDSFENTVNAGFTTNIINPGQESFYITDTNKEDLFLSVRNILSEVKLIIDPYKKNEENLKESLKEKLSTSSKRILKRMISKTNTRFAITQDIRKLLNNKYLVINGDSLNTIMNDNYLKYHFIFLLSLVKNVVGYKLSPEHKQTMVNIIQQFFDDKTVLAIGDGHNDNLMMQNADISIEIINNADKVINHAGDIQISGLKYVKQLILLDGKSLFERMDSLILFLFYKDYLIGFVLFFFNWYSSFTGTKVFDSIYIFLYQFILSSFNIVIFGAFDTPFKPEVVKRFTGLYLDGTHKKINIIGRFLIKGISEAILQSVIIFYFTIYCVNKTVDDEGKGIDLGILMVILAAAVLFVPNLKILFVCSSHKVLFAWFGYLFSIGIYICFIFTTDHRKFELINYENQYKSVFNRANCLLTLAFVIWASCLISYIMHKQLFRILIPTLDEYFSAKNEGGVMWSREIASLHNKELDQVITNKGIVDSQFEEISLGRLVKRIFKNTKIMDYMIQEMLNPSDIDLVNLRLNKYSLKIIDENLERKYYIHRVKKCMKPMRIYYILVVLMYGGYSLADSISTDDSVIGFVRLSIFIFFLAYWIIMLTPLFENYYTYITGFAFACGIAAVIALQWETSDYKIALSCGLVSMITTTNLNQKFLYICFLNICFYASYFAKLGKFYYDDNSFTIDVAKDNNVQLFKFFIVCSFVLLLLSIGVLNLFILYEDEKLKRNDYLAQSSLEYEKNIRQDILSILVPKFVKDSINQGEKALQQEQTDVVILFCDICDFDKIIASKGRHIVEILDELFRKYDGLCINHGIQKIETVGKTYMACAGIKACEYSVPPHILQVEKTKRIINAAFDMMNEAETNDMKIKIGVHRGKVIAGVIGYHKPQFSLIGDTVNTTSRVCSTGEDGKITISAETYEKVKMTEFFFEPKKVEAKGKGMIQVYQCLKNAPAKKGKFVNAMTNAIHKINLKKKEKMTESTLQGVEKAQDIIKKVFGKRVSVMNDDIIKQKTFGVDLCYEKKISDLRNNDIENNLNEEDRDLDDSLDDEESGFDYVNQERYSLILYNNKEGSDLLYYDDLRKNTITNYKFSLLVFIFAYLFQTLIIISVRYYIYNYLVILLLKGGLAFCCIFVLFILRQSYRYLLLKIILLLIFSGGLILAVVQGFNSRSDPKNRNDHNEELNTVQVIELTLIYAFASILPPIPFIGGFFLYVMSVVLFIVVFGIMDIFTPENCFYFFTFTLIHLIKLYFQKRYLIKSYNNLQKRTSDKIQQEGLVSQLLPSHAFEKLKNINALSKLELVDEFDEVTLLFADIAGFTKYSSSVSADQVVYMLRCLFTEFDKCCLQYKVYKVYTIGDCYVVMGFTNAARRNPVEEALNVVKMGLSMIEIIREEREKVGFKDLDMRIGIHTGHIIGGIIGTDIVRYDIYGKDVVLANKMESNGLEGNIMVSETTKNMIERDKNSGFRFEFRKKVECKAVENPMNAYLILKKADDAMTTEH